MTKVSKANADQHWVVAGMFDAAGAEVEGHSITLQSYDVDFDFAFAYKGMPNDECQASHVGYVVKGRVTFSRADGTEEVVEGGEAFVIEPGHNMAVTAGTEFVAFTPIEQDQSQAPVVMANMMKFAAEHGIDVSG